MTTVEILTAFDIFVRWSLTAVVWAALIVLTCLALRWTLRKIEAGQDRAWKRAREKWPAPFGVMTGTDQEPPDPDWRENDDSIGGIPAETRQSRSKAPETGSGLPGRGRAK